MVLTVFGGIAEFERSLIATRTEEDGAAATIAAKCHSGAPPRLHEPRLAVEPLPMTAARRSSSTAPPPNDPRLAPESGPSSSTPTHRLLRSEQEAPRAGVRKRGREKTETGGLRRHEHDIRLRRTPLPSRCTPTTRGANDDDRTPRTVHPQLALHVDCETTGLGFERDQVINVAMLRA